jgi:hypothetical protein
MTILLLMVLMRGRLHQIRGSRTTRAGRHRTIRVDHRQTRITDGTMGLRPRIKGDPMTTRRHRPGRIGTGIAIEITTTTVMANHITMCTPHQELL